MSAKVLNLENELDQKSLGLALPGTSPPTRQPNEPRRSLSRRFVGRSARAPARGAPAENGPRHSADVSQGPVSP